MNALSGHTFEPSESVDSAETQRNRVSRQRHHFRVFAPAARIAAYSILLTLAALHEALIGDGLARVEFVAATVFIVVYAITVTLWARSNTEFRRTETRIQVADMSVYTAIIFATGAEASLLFFGPLTIIVLRYTHSPRELAKYAALSPLPLWAATALAAMLNDHEIDQSRLAMTSALLLLFAAYLVMMGFESYRVRRQVTQFAKNAQAAANAKTQFIASISHELRTPLNGIMGMSKILSFSNLTKEQGEQLDVVQRSSETLLALINEILDFSKLNASEMKMEHIPIAIRQIVKDVEKLLNVLAQENGATLEFSQDIPEWILGDETRIRQVLMNVIGNAIKFTPHGRVQVRAFVATQQSPNILADMSIDIARTSRWQHSDIATDTSSLWLVFEVQDTGIGMSEAVLEKVFEPFNQADASTTRRFGGTGLGLSIVKNLMQAMQGGVAARSVEGEGSCFRMWCKLDLADAPLLGSAKSEPPEFQDSVTLKILVAEDNPVNQTVARAMLEQLGHKVELVTNGQEAVAAVSGNRYDAVLMDMMMPVMDGLEASRAISKLETPPPVIALTANVAAEDKAQCQAAGMVDFVSKPMQIEVLAEALFKATR